MVFDRRTVISFLVIGGFFLALFLYLIYPPDANEAQSAIINMMIGALIGSVTTVIAYDFGSSSGSKAKDDALVMAARGEGTGAGMPTAAPPFVPTPPPPQQE